MGYIYICEFGYLMRPFATELLQFKIPFEKYDSIFNMVILYLMYCVFRFTSNRYETYHISYRYNRVKVISQTGD
jgi:hypothetical protein